MAAHDDEKRFRTYSNYLVALSELLKAEHPTLTDLGRAISTSAGFHKLNRGKIVQYEEVGKMLRLSWYTELLLQETGKYPALLPYAAPWSMVECYYALYPIIRAYFLAAGRAVAKSHAVSLRTLGSDLRVCKGRFPRPWCCMLLADPKVPPISFVNTPCPAPVIRLKNPLYSPYSGIPCQHYGLFLKTTRRRQIDKATIDWKRHHGRKRISKVERLTVVARIKPTTIFDALYRIRTRSNYQDIDSFLFSNATAVDFSRLHAAICNITNYSLMMFETLIARMIGKKPFEAIVSGFLVSPLGSPGSQTIGLRWPIIKLLF